MICCDKGVRWYFDILGSLVYTYWWYCFVDVAVLMAGGFLVMKIRGRREWRVAGVLVFAILRVLVTPCYHIQIFHKDWLG